MSKLSRVDRALKGATPGAKTGVTGQSHFMVPMFGNLLRRMAARLPCNPKVPLPVRTRGRPPVIFNDEQVREIRALHEKSCWTPQRCAEHFDTSIEYMRRLLSYEVRSKVR